MSLIKDSSKVFIGISSQRLFYIFTIPVTTRLVGPSDYGIFNVAVAMCTLLSIIGGLSLEASIAVSETKSQAVARTIGASLMGIVNSILLGGIVYLLLPLISNYYSEKIIKALLIMMPIIMPLLAVNISLQNLLGFSGQFKYIAIVDIISPIINFSTFIIFYFILWRDYQSLIAAFIISYLIKMFIFLYASKHEHILSRDKFKLKNFEFLFLIRNFTLFNLPSKLLNNANIQLPPIILSAVFPEHFVGLFVMARKIITIPTNLSSKALGMVFYPKAAKEYRDTGKLNNITWQTFILSCQYTLYPAILTAAAASPVLSLLLGSKWEGISVYIVLLLPVTLINAVQTQIGIGFIFNIIKQQYKILIGNILLFILRIIPLIACILLKLSEFLTILCFSLGGALGYGILLAWIFNAVSIPVIESFKVWLKYCIIALLCVFPLFGAVRTDSSLLIIFLIAISILIYSVIVWFRFLTAEQRSYIISKIYNPN